MTATRIITAAQAEEARAWTHERSDALVDEIHAASDEDRPQRPPTIPPLTFTYPIAEQPTPISDSNGMLAAWYFARWRAAHPGEIGEKVELGKDYDPCDPATFQPTHVVVATVTLATQRVEQVDGSFVVVEEYR